MTRSRCSAATAAVLLALAPIAQAQSGPNPTPAAAPTTPAAAPVERELHAQLLQEVRQAMTLSATLKIDAELRGALGAMVEQHLTRVDALLDDWLREEQRQSPDLSLAMLRARLWARLLNEETLWRADTVDARHEEAWIALLSKPALCWIEGTPSSLDVRALALQQAPPAERPRLLEAEQALLQRWGTRRARAPTVPLPDIDEQVDGYVGRLKAGETSKLAPMAPALAALLLEEDKRPDLPMNWIQRCTRAQWWLRQQPAGSPTARAAALDGMRYDLARPRFEPRVLEAGADNPLPPVAAWYGITATITVQMKVSATGQVTSATVSARDIAVPGIRDNPPLAFATVLDKTAIRQALRQTIVPAATPQDGLRTVEQRYEFRVRD